MTSQQCNTNSYGMVVLHTRIHEPLVRSQPKPKIVRSATGSTEYGKPTLDLHLALSAPSTDLLTVVMPHYVRSKGESHGFCAKYR